jgi:ABC-type glutathione transport system ATPase component
MTLASLAESIVGIGRISTFLTAEELADPYTRDPASKYAIDVDGDFTWEVVEAAEEEYDDPFASAASKELRKAEAKKREKAQKKAKKDAEKARKKGLPLPTTAITEEKQEIPPDPPFELKGLKLAISRGSFVGIVGQVGSGKVLSSITYPDI